MHESIDAILQQEVRGEELWSGAYKIPWNDPTFSHRMLAEHLSQDHDLASRKRDRIQDQVQWIHSVIQDRRPGRLLDLGCGPGLYLAGFSALGYACQGIDFSPASIAYAREELGPEITLVEGDIRQAPFGKDYDLITLLYGELNVFSPAEAKRILPQCYQALAPGGVLLVEGHCFEAVQRIGQAPDTWYRSGPGVAGLFSEAPYLCLVENQWFAQEQTALQQFYVLEAGQEPVRIYRSTTKAWTNQDYAALVQEAGFLPMSIASDFPGTGDDLQLLVIRKG